MIFNLEKAAPGGNDTESADVILRAKAATKSLRWLANMFKGEALEDETDKICRCIHLYCTAGADSIDALQAQLAASQQETREAVKELRGLCWCCVNGKKWDKAAGWSNMTACEHLRERGTLAVGGGKAGKNCPYWEWRGPQEAREEPHAD